MLKNKDFITKITAIILIIFSVYGCSKNDTIDKYDSLDKLNINFLKENTDFIYLKSFEKDSKYYNVYYANSKKNKVKIISIKKDKQQFEISKISNDFIVNEEVTYWVEKDKYGIKCSFKNKIDCVEEFK
ncbi:hypothetical protein OKW23_000862 [Bacilli bacterium PM5-9]|nr:hypothetical protein [Bacilli bacterium PM5-9]